MSISTARTIIIGSGANPTLNAMVLSDPLRWPAANPGASLDGSIDITAVLADINDELAAVSVSAAPSGPGELELLGVTAVGGVITVYRTGGVPGRNYTIRIDAVTVGWATLEFEVGLFINRLLATFPLPAPPAPGFGAAVTWSPGDIMPVPATILPALTFVATGPTPPTQLGAAPLTLSRALVNAGAGLAVLLPQASTFGGAEMPVYNRTGGTLTIFPYSGDTIEGQSVNGGVTLENEQTARFSVANSGLLILS